MGFFNEIRKALFGAKSVAKSATRKAVDAGKEAGEELVEKSEEWLDQAKDFGEEVQPESDSNTDDFNFTNLPDLSEYENMIDWGENKDPGELSATKQQNIYRTVNPKFNST